MSRPVKPGSVVDNHSSRTYVTVRLKQPTRPQRGPRQRGPIWSCSEWSLPCHELLPAARCALTAPFHPYLIPCLRKGHRRFALCCTSRRLAPPRRYLALCPMEPGLSSPYLRRQRLSGPTHGAHYTLLPPKLQGCWLRSFYTVWISMIFTGGDKPTPLHLAPT